MGMVFVGVLVGLAAILVSAVIASGGVTTPPGVTDLDKLNENKEE